MCLFSSLVYSKADDTNRCNSDVSWKLEKGDTALKEEIDFFNRSGRNRYTVVLHYSVIVNRSTEKD